MGGIGCGLGSIKVTPACSGSPQSDPRGLYGSARVRGSRGRCQAPIPSRRSEAASLVLRFAVWVRARHAAGGERARGGDPGLGVRANFPLPRVHRPGSSGGAPGRAVPRAGPPPLPKLRARRRIQSLQSRLETRARGAGEGPQQAESRVGRGRRSAPPTLLRRQPPPPPRFGARGLAQAGAGARRHFQGGRSAPGPRYLYIQSGRRSPLLGASARPAPPPLRMPEGVVAPGPGPPGAASRCNPRGRSLGRGAGAPRARSPSRTLPGGPAPELLAGRRHRAELGRRSSPHTPRPFPARARTRRAPRRPSPPRP